MKIVKDYPPNIEAIRAKFTLHEYVVFTYGDTLYNPGGWKIADDLMVHEETHVVQQGDDPAGWWNKYLNDEKFRLEQEIEAYRNQYLYFRENRCIKPNGKIRASRLGEFVSRIASDLSSEIYGNIINYQEARERIQNV